MSKIKRKIPKYLELDFFSLLPLPLQFFRPQTGNSGLTRGKM